MNQATDKFKNFQEETITNRTYKDGVFTTLFHDKKKICELYNALKDTDEYKESDIELQTLEKALYKLHRDDLAFSVDKKLVILVEHQSTPSKNLPIRMLIYIARVYERLLNLKPVYSDTLVEIPFPELYVFYNGEKEWAEELTLKLSDAYMVKGVETFLEVSVKVLNINQEKHNPILNKSETLKEYSLFIQRIRDYLHQGYTQDKAIAQGIRDCIKENILKDFLSKHGGEIYNMIFEEFNMETALEVAKEDGKAEGEIRGKGEGVKALFEVLLGLDIPKPVIREKLYEKYSDMPEVIDDLLLHEDEAGYSTEVDKKKVGE